MYKRRNNKSMEENIRWLHLEKYYHITHIQYARNEDLREMR